MENKIEQLMAEVENIKISSADDLEQYRLKYLVKKGEINQLFNDFKDISGEEKRVVGKTLNELKVKAEEIYENYKIALQSTIKKESKIDLTATSENIPLGSRHPLSLTRNRIIEIFNRIGFTISEGPEIEDDWHVFSSLNFADEHPARDMQDTFFIEANPDIILRTHTSSVQARVMSNEKPPIRTVSPGRVFRNEAISARAHCIFHQLEGLYIDENVSFTDLKQTLLYFAKELFGEETNIRMRPSYFPFTEPSAEVDITCTICGGKGCNVCKHTGWLEIMGCGMVDPNVLENNKIDSKKYTGYAFGMGIERITMLLYQIKDIRLYFENDIKFINQFKNVI